MRAAVALQKNWTISVAGVTFPSFATNINQSCVSGSAVGPLLPAAGYEVANLITVTMEPDVRKWCWGQCTSAPSFPSLPRALSPVWWWS